MLGNAGLGISDSYQKNSYDPVSAELPEENAIRKASGRVMFFGPAF
jgi:hypothetical protein